MINNSAVNIIDKKVEDLATLEPAKIEANAE